MFKIGDRVFVKKGTLVYDGPATIVERKYDAIVYPGEEVLLGIRYDSYQSYMSPDDCHHILINKDPYGEAPSLEDLVLIEEPNDILKGML